MNVSLAWLRDFVNTPTPGAELGERFRMTSSECEGVTDWNERLEGLVIGQVTAVEPHPNADRLRVTTVNIGTHTRTIVCGAPNVAKGQYVIVAVPGTTLRPVQGEPLTLKEVEIRGVRSQGMLCALEEIGIAVPSEGIFVLDEAVKPGTSAATALFENDTVIDLEITPNRPDLLSHLGLAREVATFERLRLNEPSISSLEKNRLAKAPELQIAGHKECWRYSAVVIENIQIKSSPWWLQSRLIRCGIRPINIVVDVTNYVMLELGQPLHAFDADSVTLNGAVKVGVRNAEPREKMLLLDGSERELQPEDIVISGPKGEGLALAGIMGGMSSAITSATTRILLESATFSPSHIRRTSRRLGLRSEASLRFEKGLDPELTVMALKRAANMLQELAGATIATRIADSSSHLSSRTRISLSFDRINQVLGVRISAADCKSILSKLGFQLPVLTKSSFEAIPPSWRRDVTQAEDVIEELIRIWGFERLPATLPVGAVKAPQPSAAFTMKESIRKTLAAAGFHETIHNPFCSTAQLERLQLNPKEAISLPNPLSQEGSHLVPNHLVGMLQTCAGTNTAYEELGLFEIGSVFSSPAQETVRLTVLARTSSNPETAISRLKAALHQVTRVIRLPHPVYSTYNRLPYAQATSEIKVAEEVIGTLTVIDSDVIAAHKIRRGRTMVALEINLEPLFKLEPHSRFYQAPSLYPTSTQDCTITITEGIEIATLEAAIAKAADTAVVQQWWVQDIYQGKPLATGERSVTFRFVLGSYERTLEESEIKTELAKLEKALTAHGRATQ